MQREKYEKVLGHLRQEYEDFKTQSKAKADEKQAKFKVELQSLCDRKDAEIDAYREQSQVDLEQQKLKTKEAEEKCQSLEKQLSGGDAGKKDLEAKLKKVCDYQSVLIEDTQETHMSHRWNRNYQLPTKPRTQPKSNYQNRRKEQKRRLGRLERRLRISCKSQMRLGRPLSPNLMTS